MLGDDVHQTLVDVLDGVDVTVVVEEDFDERTRVLAEPLNHVEEDKFLLERRGAHFEDRKKNLVEQDFQFAL